MSQRILSLTRYLLQSLLFSLSGILFILLALVTYQIFFAPGQRTPEMDYFTLVLGVFGGGTTFLLTLAFAGRANDAASYTLLVRLPSRIEYLVAVLLAALAFAVALQGLLAALALSVAGVQTSLGELLQVPPIWLAVDVLASVLALHASDFASSGWSRSLLFGALLLLLFTQGNGDRIAAWSGDRLLSVSNWLYGRSLTVLAGGARGVADWLFGTGGAVVARALGLLFWPFRAITAGVTSNLFTEVQALAPALLLLYATVLFLLLSDLFAGKDLILAE